MTPDEQDQQVVAGIRATYLAAAETFHAVLATLGADDLARPVPSCPGWTVSDVVTHVHDNQLAALGPGRTAIGDPVATYVVGIAHDPALAASAPFDAVDLLLHAWDVSLAVGEELRLDEGGLGFLEVFAREAGDRLYVEEGFERLTGAAADPAGLDRQGVALLPYGRRAPDPA